MRSHHWGFVACVLTTDAFLSLAAVTSPALACKGTETLFRDDFTDVDPAWIIKENDTNVRIEAGVLTVKSDIGHNYWLQYGGQDFPSADACIDIIAPSDKPSADVLGGLGFWTGKAWHIAYIATDGSAGVNGLQNGSWITPVPIRRFDGIKTTPKATNQLRVTWNAPPESNSKAAPNPTVTIFINDKQFIKYKVAPNSDRTIMIYTQSGGAEYKYKNLVITSYTPPEPGSAAHQSNRVEPAAQPEWTGLR